MNFKEKNIWEKLAFIVSDIAGVLFIIIGLNQIFGFLLPDTFLGKSFLISWPVIAGIIDLILAFVIFLIEYEVLKGNFVENYLYRGILYLVFAFILSTCATIALGGILYIISYYVKK